MGCFLSVVALGENDGGVRVCDDAVDAVLAAGLGGVALRAGQYVLAVCGEQIEAVL